MWINPYQHAAANSHGLRTADSSLSEKGEHLGWTGKSLSEMAIHDARRVFKDVFAMRSKAALGSTKPKPPRPERFSPEMSLHDFLKTSLTNSNRCCNPRSRCFGFPKRSRGARLVFLGARKGQLKERAKNASAESLAEKKAAGCDSRIKKCINDSFTLRRTALDDGGDAQIRARTFRSVTSWEPAHARHHSTRITQTIDHFEPRSWDGDGFLSLPKAPTWRPLATTSSATEFPEDSPRPRDPLE